MASLKGKRVLNERVKNSFFMYILRVTKFKKEVCFVMFKQIRKERGFTLVEVIIVMSVIASMTSVVAPKAIEARKKSESNMLRDEFNSALSAIHIDKPITYSVVVSMTTNEGVNIFKDAVIPIAPSAAFGRTLRHEPFRRLLVPVGTGTVNESRPLVLKYEDNKVRVYSPIDIYGSIHTLDNPTESVEFRGGVDKAYIDAPGLTMEGGAGLSPLFSLREEKLHEDFVLSPSGLDLGEFQEQFTGSYADVLAGIFGGPTEEITMSYYPFEPTNTVERYLVKSPIELTKVNTQLLEESSVGASLDRLTDSSLGTLYQVTSMMSRFDFTNYVAGKTSIFGTANADDMYEKLDEGFDVGELVYIPHRAKDIIYSTKSDLKYGYYRD